MLKKLCSFALIAALFALNVYLWGGVFDTATAAGTKRFGSRGTEIIQETINDPVNLSEASKYPIWWNKSGYTLTISTITAIADADDTDITLTVITDISDFTATGNTGTMCISADGTSIYTQTASSGSLPITTVANGAGIVFDNDANDAPEYVTIIIEGDLR